MSDITGKITTSDKSISNIIGQQGILIANRLITPNADGCLEASTINMNIFDNLERKHLSTRLEDTELTVSHLNISMPVLQLKFDQIPKSYTGLGLESDAPTAKLNKSLGTTSNISEFDK